MKNYNKAEELLKKVIESDEFDSNAYFHLGEVYSRLKRHQDAIDALSKSIELNGADVIAKFYLAFEYKEIGEIQTAIKLYEEVISQSPDYSWAYYNLASIYLELENDDKAIFYLERTIKTNPNDIPAIKLLVKILSKHKKYVVAENILKKATVTMPLEADIYYLLAQVYKCLNNKMNYLKYLKFTEKKVITFSGDKDTLMSEIKELEEN